MRFAKNTGKKQKSAPYETFGGFIERGLNEMLN
jgi:hypothetical protein